MKKILFVLLCMTSCAAALCQPGQQPTQIMGAVGNTIGVRGSFVVDSAQGIPIRDTTFTPYRLGFITFRAADSALYVYSSTYGNRWRKYFPAVKQPLTGIVGGGGPNDPVAGANTFVNTKLIGLGNRIVIVVDNIVLTNYGTYPAFTYTPGTGTINISPNVWISGSILYINLNQ